MVEQLMIGNYVTTILSDFPQQIKSLKQNTLVDGIINFVGFGKNGDSLPPEHIYGIPLTEDILTRCGFEIKIKNTFKTAYELFEYPKIDVIFYPKEGYVFRFKGQEMVMIKHLHTLQNLVKLLCNQTIELK